MSDKRYMIKEAAKKISVEPHVLRYWEEELDLNINRNEMGHRYYTDKDISVLETVRDLKNQGILLKVIKSIIPDIYGDKPFDLNMLIKFKNEIDKNTVTPIVIEEVDKPEKVKEGKLIEMPRPKNLSNVDKMQQFQEIMTKIVSNALKENSKSMTEEIGKNISDEVIDKLIKQMEFLNRETDEKEEERYRKLDETIRELQKARMEAAVTQIETRKKKRGMRRAK